MRNQRAAANFLEKERLDLAEQQQRQQAAFQGASLQQRAIESESHAKIQEQATAARIQLEAKRIELEREQTVARSVTDFGRTGTAFIPSYAADQIPKLMGSAASSEFAYTTIDLPGSGTIIQRIGGPGEEEKLAEIEKIHSQIDRYRQQNVLDIKRGEAIAAQNEERAQKIKNMVGKVSATTHNTVTTQLEGLRKMAAEKARILSASPSAADRQMGREAAADPRSAFAEGSAERDRWDELSAINDGWLAQVKAGMAAPQNTDVETFRNLGLSAAVFGDPITPSGPTGPATSGVRIVGRITDERGQTFLIGEQGQKIPTTDRDTPVSQIGTLTPGAPAPTKQTSTPSPAEEAQKEAAIKVFQDTSRPPAERQQARDFLKAYKARYVR